MASSYTRNFAKVTGDTIEAADFNNEFQLIDDAFNKDSGHSHDGSADEGGYVPLISDDNHLNAVVVDSTNNEIDFFLNVGAIKTQQMKLVDGALLPAVDNDIDLGSATFEFKDGYFDGILYADNINSDSITVTGNITVGGTVDGRDIATDGLKLDGIEALADVTDTTNVTAAGALMDSELTNITAVKALNQGVATTDSPTFAGVEVEGNLEASGRFSISTAPVSPSDAVATITQSGANYRDVLKLTSAVAGRTAWNWIEAGSDFVVNGVGDVVIGGGLSVGGTSSDRKLHIQGTDGSGYLGIKLENTLTGAVDYQILTSSDTAGIGGGKFVVYNQTDGRFDLTIDGDGQFISNGPIIAQGTLTASQTSSGVLEQSGNITRIRAYGAAAGTGEFAVRVAGGGGSADSEAIRVKSTLESVFYGVISTTEAVQLTANSTTPSAGAFIYRPASNTLMLGTASTDRLEITSGGDLEVQGGNMVFNSSALLTAASGYDLRLGANGADKVRIKTNGNLRLVSSSAPATASSTGSEGEIAVDSSYIYVCTATNTWKRASLATW